ncbi:nitrate/nitrite transporter [Chelatococcus asaccharovorans]|uniref:nitrate/nitrite transporter n=1 Tax=Chelatococcus asaccharovorans TaxID=28210 RepID=UPI00224C6B81|nr:nitrate/nitrite transporter [Chelatococcus asaccharovorans]CAH1661747.1 Nitrate transporter [Chelatococcus asaccharovorans]CAH1689509.1 Nitrate transporter [Chelatococcus asaccharovorans]
MKRSFLAAGHLPTLVACFAYFDLSFAVWVLLGPLAVFIAQDLQLNPGQTGLMVAVPVLAGAVLRFVNGILVGQWKARRVGIVMQLVVIGALAAAWIFGVHSYAQLLVLGCLLGVAGASFAIALPMVSYWYPPEHQGTALGLAGAGNSGTVFASLLAPSLAVALGWQNVLGLAAIPLVAVFALFFAVAKDSPNAPPRRSTADYGRLLRTGDAWWLMFFYCVSFGGFVGLSSFLPIYFHNEFGLTPVTAGYLTAACVFAGSFARPFGGALADRVGGTRALMVVYAIVAIALTIVAKGALPMNGTLGVLLVGMVALGMGNGAVFQLVPQRFDQDVGLMTGLVGMTGGIGGFALAATLGYAKQFTGSYALGLALFALLALVAWGGITAVRIRWRQDADQFAGARV